MEIFCDCACVPVTEIIPLSGNIRLSHLDIPLHACKFHLNKTHQGSRVPFRYASYESTPKWGRSYHRLAPGQAPLMTQPISSFPGKSGFLSCLFQLQHVQSSLPGGLLKTTAQQLLHGRQNCKGLLSCLPTGTQLLGTSGSSPGWPGPAWA